MAKIVKRKEQINATVSPWLKKRCTEIAQGPDFSSISDIVSQALSEFIAKYDDKKDKETKKHEKKIPEILIHALMQTKNGQEWLESINNSSKKSFIKRKELENCKNFPDKREESDYIDGIELLCKMFNESNDQEDYSTEK